MNRHLLLCLATGAVVPAVLGCSAGGEGAALDVGTNGKGGTVGGNSAGGGSNLMIQIDGSASSALSAHIEENHVTVDVITLSCVGDCADVLAVPQGGFPPYQVTWEDGSTNPARHVCPTSATAYEVSVTDKGFSSVEFKRAPQTVKAPLTAHILQCTSADAGTARSDAGIGTTPTGPCDSVADTFVAAGANPHGAWSYGRTAGLGGAFTLYPFFYPFTPASQGAFIGAGFPDAAQWFDKSLGYIDVSTGYSIPPVPAAESNTTAAPSHPDRGNFAGDSYTLAPGQFALAPGGAYYSVARWTAASPGAFVVNAAFIGLCGDNGAPLTTADAHVQHNGTDLGNGLLNLNGSGNTFVFAQKIVLAAGDTLDFGVGTSGGAFLCNDVTALDARVCPVLPAAP
jgi:hypothetical protein